MKEKIKNMGYAIKIMGYGLFVIILSILVIPITGIISIILKLKEGVGNDNSKNKP